MENLKYLLSASALLAIAAGAPPPALVGTYLCSTEQRAYLASDHREGADTPRAAVNESRPTTFKLQIIFDAANPTRLRAIELPYQGSDRDRAEWQDEKSVLHDIYVGTNGVFRPANSPAFLTVETNRAGNLQFYHAGFELPGSEDTQLAIRWGRCKKAR
jgi:hypothetical protein